MHLKDKVAVVTGAGSGIGESVTLRLSREGAKLAVLDINGDAGERVAAEVRSRGCEALALETDVSNKDNVQAAIREVATRFGTVHILVNNAGVVMKSPAEEMAEDTWNRVLNVNLKGCFLCSQAVIPHMKQQQYGRIVNISSISAVRPRPDGVNYASSKLGVIGLTKAMATELGPLGITVNAIAPGLIDTPMSRGNRPKDYQKSMIEETPVRRIGVPDDIASAVLFFVSDEASYITGQHLFVCGGRSIGYALI